MVVTMIFNILLQIWSRIQLHFLIIWMHFTHIQASFNSSKRVVCIFVLTRVRVYPRNIGRPFLEVSVFVVNRAGTWSNIHIWTISSILNRLGIILILLPDLGNPLIQIIIQSFIWRSFLLIHWRVFNHWSHHASFFATNISCYSIVFRERFNPASSVKQLSPLFNLLINVSKLVRRNKTVSSFWIFDYTLSSEKTWSCRGIKVLIFVFFSGRKGFSCIGGWLVIPA